MADMILGDYAVNATLDGARTHANQQSWGVDQFNHAHDLQPFDLESQLVNDRQVTLTSHEEIVLEEARHPDVESAGSAVLGRGARDEENEEHGPTKARNRSKFESTRMTVLVFGVLTLIVVPGLVLGLLTKEIPAGIALSGAIATVASFFAGLYFYKNK